MLTELNLAQYPAVQRLFEPLSFNLLIRSVIEGHTPAWVFADSASQPQVALLWDLQDALKIAGDPHSHAAIELPGLIFDRILPNARARGIPQLALFYTPGWEAVLPGLLPGLTMKPAWRFSYRLPDPWNTPPILPRLPLPYQPQLTPDYELRRIDDGLLASRLRNLDQVRGWIDSFWRSPAEFLHFGCGYCILQGDVIAAWCLTVFAAGQEREVGLATVPEFRERGLATRVAAACVDHLLVNRQLPHWHCWADNRPSAAIAEKIGFVPEREYSVFRVSLA